MKEAAVHMIGRAGLIPVLLSTVLCALSCGLPGRAAAQELCPPASAMPIPRLPHARLALATNQPILIVALGSSSTRGWMATDIGHSYPSWLQRVLNDALPKAAIAVINRGIGGQDAPEELARLYQDVLALRPQIVIWQAGANGAIRDASPAAFKILMQEGIGELKAAGVDVILMDNQRAPKILSAPEHAQMDLALRDVTATTGVNLFSRGALMDQWAATGATLDDFIAPDGLHMNNRGYYCLAQSLGGAIATALRQPLATQTAGVK
jgi:lysophospholipase L1-like esterase